MVHKLPYASSFPFDYSPYGAPRQPRHRSLETAIREAEQTQKERRNNFYRRRARTPADEAFERRKYPGMFD